MHYNYNSNSNNNNSTYNITGKKGCSRALSFVFFVGLATLGVKSFNKDPPGSDMDRISSEVFLKEA